LQDQTLTVKGKIGSANPSDKAKLKAVDATHEPATEYLHRGIATRAFERRFQLADHIRVGQAHLDHGLLKIDLVRELPEALKPRKIAISGGQATDPTKIIENAA